MNNSINLDTRWLRDLVETLQYKEFDPLYLRGVVARLTSIADNIDKLEELTSSAYNRGIIEGERRIYARRNLRDEAVPEPQYGPLLSAMTGETVPVKKIPAGARTIDPVTNRPFGEVKKTLPKHLARQAETARDRRIASLHVDLSSIDL